MKIVNIIDLLQQRHKIIITHNISHCNLIPRPLLQIEYGLIQRIRKERFKLLKIYEKRRSTQDSK